MVLNTTKKFNSFRDALEQITNECKLQIPKYPKCNDKNWNGHMSIIICDSCGNNIHKDEFMQMHGIYF